MLRATYAPPRTRNGACINGASPIDLGGGLGGGCRPRHLGKTYIGRSGKRAVQKSDESQISGRMRTQAYFYSLATEVEALKDRVRYLIEDAHWQTNGEWKESVIRQVLRRHLPQSVSVGRGFVVTETATSRQIDVLIVDSGKPVLFRDGHLTFVTPDAVLGVIEVKSTATPAIVKGVAAKLVETMLLVRLHPNTRAFAGLFAFEEHNGNPRSYLSALADAAPRCENRLDFVCLGSSRFLRYWEFNPENPKRLYEGWNSYRLDGLAPGYFVHNVIDAISPESVLRNNDVWFPRGGKEPYRDAAQPGRWPAERSDFGGSRPTPRPDRRRR